MDNVHMSANVVFKFERNYQLCMGDISFSNLIINQCSKDIVSSKFLIIVIQDKPNKWLTNMSILFCCLCMKKSKCLKDVNILLTSKPSISKALGVSVSCRTLRQLPVSIFNGKHKIWNVESILRKATLLIITVSLLTLVTSSMYLNRDLPFSK